MLKGCLTVILGFFVFGGIISFFSDLSNTIISENELNQDYNYVTNKKNIILKEKPNGKQIKKLKKHKVFKEISEEENGYHKILDKPSWWNLRETSYEGLWIEKKYLFKFNSEYNIDQLKSYIAIHKNLFRINPNDCVKITDNKLHGKQFDITCVTNKNKNVTRYVDIDHDPNVELYINTVYEDNTDYSKYNEVVDPFSKYPIIPSGLDKGVYYLVTDNPKKREKPVMTYRKGKTEYSSGYSLRWIACVNTPKFFYISEGFTEKETWDSGQRVINSGTLPDLTETVYGSASYYIVTYVCDRYHNSN